MTDNIVRFGTKKTLAQEEAEQAALEAKYKDFKETSLSRHQEEMLESIEMLKELVTKGTIDSFLFVARSPENGFFVDHSAINVELAKADLYYGYAGKLEDMKLNMVDSASAGPHITLDGKMFAITEPVDLEEGGE